MYKLASATRGDRALIDCTGPWLTLTPWPNAWWNLNVQLTYWPLNAANRLELAARSKTPFITTPTSSAATYPNLTAKEATPWHALRAAIARRSPWVFPA